MNINKKIMFNLFYILLMSLIIIFSLNLEIFAGYPKLVSKLLDAFNNIKSYLVAMATPVAAIAIASGFLMQKFSFGDEERLRTGKRLIRGSLFSYAFILCIDLILSAIKLLVSAEAGGD